MGIKSIFNKLFGNENKSSDAKKTVSLIQQICTSMDLLEQKAGNLNSQFEEEKENILKLNQDVKTFVSVDEILGAKFEQEILGAITSVSFACESALAGTNAEQVKKTLSALNSLISQRLALQVKE